jgi:hypothetical protein
LTAILKTFAVVTLGVALGLLSTWLAVERGHGFGAVSAGVWTSWPKTGSMDADPYGRAVVARTGEVPLGVAEGLSFLARTDASGEVLTGRCEYFLQSPVPTGRFWTITPLTLDGGRFAGTGERSGMTSGEIVRRADGSFEIVLSREVRPGNWIPLGKPEPFQLMLRVYDTQVSSTAAAIDVRVTPRVVRGKCA